MNLAMFSQAALERAAHDARLALTSEQTRDIAEAESICLAERKRFLEEAQFLARFDVNDMAARLDSWRPDCRGLLVNQYEPILETWQEGRLQYNSESI